MSIVKTLSLAAGLALAACGPLVQVGGNAPAPQSLLTVTANAAAPTSVSGAPLLITTPSVPGKLKTLRIPVTTNANEVEYLGAATWLEQPNKLFHRVLIDTFESRTGRPALDERDVNVVPAARLSGDLLEFGLDVAAGSVVRVRYDAMLGSPDGGMLATRRFETTEPVSAETGPAVAYALGQAANRIAADVADWAGSARPAG
ncbi:MAG: ABC-type transport auxiliary lipoprotein family protein [Pacificimonas sp.]